MAAKLHLARHAECQRVSCSPGLFTQASEMGAPDYGELPAELLIVGGKCQLGGQANEELCRVPRNDSHKFNIKVEGISEQHIIRGA